MGTSAVFLRSKTAHLIHFSLILNAVSWCDVHRIRIFFIAVNSTSVDSVSMGDKIGCSFLCVMKWAVCCLWVRNGRIPLQTCQSIWKWALFSFEDMCSIRKQHFLYACRKWFFRQEYLRGSRIKGLWRWGMKIFRIYHCSVFRIRQVKIFEAHNLRTE